MNTIQMMFAVIILIVVGACSKDNDSVTTPIIEGSDPNFKIVANNDGVLSSFSRKVSVFGINIYAVAAVEDEKLLHAANVMAQYLDNDEDGSPDNPAVVNKMTENNAFMVMWKNENDLNIDPPSGWEGQDLGNDETHPAFVSSGMNGSFDASLEEVLHLITHVGYANVYPDVFGEAIGSEIADAMDIARGGQFTSIPNPYPAGAWYTYDDSTCDYACMVAEYHYWALTSILGAQVLRLNEIQQEWRLNTRDKVEQQDIAVYGLLTDPQYAFPAKLPDGSYRH